MDTDSEVVKVYRIVGEDEANLREGKISVMSPIARALIGKSLDDVVLVATPGGDLEYEITKYPTVKVQLQVLPEQTAIDNRLLQGTSAFRLNAVVIWEARV